MRIVYQRPLVFWTLVLLMLFASQGVTAQGGSDYRLSWYAISSGYGSSAGNAWQLVGSAGQPQASIASGGAYTLAGGFWAGVKQGGSRIYLPLIVR